MSPTSMTPIPRASEMLRDASRELRPYLRPEFLETQIEIATPVCTDLAELEAALRWLRRELQDLAGRAGCQVLPSGTSLLPSSEASPLTPGARYAHIAQEVGYLVRPPGLSACHVHIGVANDAHRIAVVDHIRPYLPVLQALGANSPFSDGVDTGYASWRSVLVDRWPGSGPAPLLGTVKGYETLVSRLISAGVVLDAGMLSWFARPSSHLPTVEVRAGDVCQRVSDTVLQAGLTRGLVFMALEKVRLGERPLEVGDLMLRGAHWRASKDGLEGDAVDLVHKERTMASRMLSRLVQDITPSLKILGDYDDVLTRIADVLQEGSGAARQRQAMSEHGQMVQVASRMSEAVLL